MWKRKMQNKIDLLLIENNAVVMATIVLQKSKVLINL